MEDILGTAVAKVPALPTVLLVATLVFTLPELFSEIVSKELRVAVTHASVDVTEAPEVCDGQLAGPEGGLDVGQVEQPLRAFQALGFGEQHSKPSIAVLSPELECVLHDLLHQLERLLDPGLYQGVKRTTPTSTSGLGTNARPGIVKTCSTWQRYWAMMERRLRCLLPVVAASLSATSF